MLFFCKIIVHIPFILNYSKILKKRSPIYLDSDCLLLVIVSLLFLTLSSSLDTVS